MASSKECPQNIDQWEKYEIFVSLGEVSIPFSRGGAANVVNSIGFNSRISPGWTGAMLEVLKERSCLIPEDAPPKVYKYVNIWLYGYDDPKNLKDARISFRVSKEWLFSAGLGAGEIKMYRYDKAWKSLDIKLIGEDDKGYTYYTASTDKFGQFAISGSKTPPITEAKAPTTEIISAPAKIQSVNWMLILGAAAFLLVASLIFILARSLKKINK